MEYIEAKTILSKLKNAPDTWFGITYNMNLYRGCQHQCIYCDSRSECYRIKDFSQIQVKENALQLLELELKRKKHKGTIGTGSMNDPYMPVEKQLKLTQRSLELISKYNFPVHIITKNKLVLRDIDLIKQIGKTYSAVSITITTTKDELGRILEPGASSSSERFMAIKTLADAGIYCGVLLMPVLPFLNDTPENIISVIEMAKKAGAKYIVGWMGMTLRDKQRDYYYEKLDKHFPGVKSNYLARYGNQYSIAVPDGIKLQSLFNATCKEFGIATAMKFFEENKPVQLDLFG
jgi:DNA repair photolyase